jgi:hypothetical protein
MTGPEQLFVDHQPRAVAFANAYCRSINPHSAYLIEDITSEALLGLWQACLRFEQTDSVVSSLCKLAAAINKQSTCPVCGVAISAYNNNTFWTFAYLRVRGAVIDYLRNKEKILARGSYLENGGEQIQTVPLLVPMSSYCPELADSVDDLHRNMSDPRSKIEFQAIEHRADIDKYSAVCGVDKISILKEFYCEEKTLVEIGKPRSLGRMVTSKLIRESTAQLRQAARV